MARPPHSMHLRALLLGLGLLLLSACAPLRSSASVAPAPEVVIESAHNATLTPLRRGSALVVEIRSDTGIGDAGVLLQKGADPRDIVLRFYLAGLENLTFTAPDGHVVTVAVSNDDPHVRQTLRSPGAATEEPITRDHEWWLPTGLVSTNPSVTPSIPLQEGFFDISVPRAFLESDFRSFTLAWVDFYR